MCKIENRRSDKKHAKTIGAEIFIDNVNRVYKEEILGRSIMMCAIIGNDRKKDKSSDFRTSLHSMRVLKIARLYPGLMSPGKKKSLSRQHFMGKLKKAAAMQPVAMHDRGEKNQLLRRRKRWILPDGVLGS